MSNIEMSCYNEMYLSSKHKFRHESEFLTVISEILLRRENHPEINGSDICKVIIKNGIDVDRIDDNHCSLVETLLDHFIGLVCGEAEEQKNPLEYIQLIEALINQGVTSIIYDDNTLLHNFIITISDFEYDKIFIDCLNLMPKTRDFNINHINSQGYTPFHLAAKYLNDGHLDVITWLIEHGADPNIEDDDGNNCLHCVSENPWPSFEIFKKICGLTDLNSVNTLDKSALMFLSEGHSLSKLEYLLSCNVNVNAQDDTGMTALMYSIRENYDEVLMAAGADPLIADIQGNNALMHRTKFWHNTLNHLIKRCSLFDLNNAGQDPFEICCDNFCHIIDEWIAEGTKLPSVTHVFVRVFNTLSSLMEGGSHINPVKLGRVLSRYIDFTLGGRLLFQAIHCGMDLKKVDLYENDLTGTFLEYVLSIQPVRLNYLRLLVNAGACITAGEITPDRLYSLHTGKLLDHQHLFLLLYFIMQKQQREEKINYEKSVRMIEDSFNREKLSILDDYYKPGGPGFYKAQKSFHNCITKTQLPLIEL